VQAFLLLQIPLYLIGILIVRLISSLKANSVLMWGCVMNFVVNVVLNYVLMQWLQVAGIALSTALVHSVSTAYLGLMLTRVLKKRRSSDLAVMG
jgi:putative peptidoglycan lipid II flippase